MLALHRQVVSSARHAEDWRVKTVLRDVTGTRLHKWRIKTVLCDVTGTRLQKQRHGRLGCFISSDSILTSFVLECEIKYLIIKAEFQLGHVPKMLSQFYRVSDILTLNTFCMTPIVLCTLIFHFAGWLIIADPSVLIIVMLLHDDLFSHVATKL